MKRLEICSYGPLPQCVCFAGKCCKDLILPKNPGFARKPHCLSASKSTTGSSAKSRKASLEAHGYYWRWVSETPCGRVLRIAVRRFFVDAAQ